MKQQLSELRSQILELTRQYTRLAHANFIPANAGGGRNFVAGETEVPYAGRVFTEAEVTAAVEGSLDFWLTLGKSGEQFEKLIGDFLGVRRSLLVNSGSSANLLAISCLTSHKLPADRRLLPGDEVITVAAGFPTTVAPILQNGANVVFIDANPQTGNARCEQLEAAYRAGKTKAVMMAHALGNPFDLRTVLEFCAAHNLWLIEDNCDALGCRYTLPSGSSLASKVPKSELSHDGSWTRHTGSWGDLSTQSFYPPHHITMGEGGVVNVVRDPRLKLLVESFRDWGRDCWCSSGMDNTCGKRFDWKLGELPDGFDHKYIYNHLGYNLKPLDLQAAIGIAQLEKLPGFIQARQDNWQYLRSGLADLEDYFLFALPTHATRWNRDGSFEWDGTGCKTECSWFGFMMTVRDAAPFGRTDFARFLTERKIGNRMLFGGNLVRQPAFVAVRREAPERVRIVGDLSGADEIMNATIFVGTYPGLTRTMLDYVIESIHDFVRTKTQTA